MTFFKTALSYPRIATPKNRNNKNGAESSTGYLQHEYNKNGTESSTRDLHGTSKNSNLYNSQTKSCFQQILTENTYKTEFQNMYI